MRKVNGPTTKELVDYFASIEDSDREKILTEHRARFVSFLRSTGRLFDGESETQNVSTES